MNKSLKAKNLPLFSIIDLDQLRRENHLEGTEVTDFFTARDGKVYLLMEQPSETQGKDWLSTPSTYTAVEIQLDWAEQRVLETTLFPLGLLKFQFHYLRPVGEQFLLRSGQIVVGLDAPLVVGEEPREGLVVGHEERLATRQAQHTCVFRLAGGRIDVRHLIVVDELQHRLIIPALFQFLINTAPQPRRHTREKFVLTRNQHTAGEEQRTSRIGQTPHFPFNVTAFHIPLG